MINTLLLFLGFTIAIVGLIDFIRLRTYKGDLRDPLISKMYNVAGLIRAGGYSCLNTQYSYLLYSIPIIYGLLYYYISSFAANGYLLGSASSLLCLYFSLEVAVSGNILTAIRCLNKLKSGFKQAYSCGRSTGTFIIGVCLVTVGVFALITEPNNRYIFMLTTALGASVVSIFARLGGGVFTKAADIGADLVGKIFHDIPEDSPENPGVIADNIGDNIGDCVGTTADIFETYICGFMTAAAFIGDSINLLLVPILASTLGSLVGINLIRNLIAKDEAADSDTILQTMILTVFSSIVASIVLYFGITYALSVTADFGLDFSTFLPFLIGILFVPSLLGAVMYYTGKSYGPVLNIADACKSGASMNIIIGYSISLEAAFVNILIITMLAFASWLVDGLRGLSISLITGLGFISTIMTMDAYGPIADNAGGIVTMAEADESARHNTDVLDSIGNLTKAVTKGYASGITVLASFLLVQLYLSTKLFPTDSIIKNPVLLFGILVGAATPFVFSGLVIRSVYKAANYMVRAISHTIAHSSPSNEEYYTSPISALTMKSITYMILPIVMLLTPFMISIVLYFTSILSSTNMFAYIAGVLFGTLASGLPLSMVMTIGGAAWDNAKKLVEDRTKARISNAKTMLEHSISNFDKSIGTTNQSFDLKSITTISEKLDKIIPPADISHEQKSFVLDNIVDFLGENNKNLKEWIANNKTVKVVSKLNVREGLDLIAHPVEHLSSKGDEAFLKVFNSYGHVMQLKSIKDAAVIGDTLGDPLKDAAGTSLNVMVKLTALIALAIFSLKQ